MKKKEIQYQAIRKIIFSLKFKGKILEIGSGNGDLCKILAGDYENEITGVDHNQTLIEKLNREILPGNLSFKTAEEYSSSNEDFGLVIGLHCCGNLSDKVVDAIVNQGSDNSALICIPCCYGKINQRETILPRSNTLSERKGEFNYFLKRVSSLEGYVDNFNSTNAMLLELYRRLIDFDRIFYLKENGYDAIFTKLTQVDGQTNSKYAKDSLMSAIVAKKN